MIGFMVDVAKKVYEDLKKGVSLTKILLGIFLLFTMSSVLNGIEYDLKSKFPTYQKISEKFEELQFSYYNFLKSLGKETLNFAIEFGETLIKPEFNMIPLYYEIQPQRKEEESKTFIFSSFNLNCNQIQYFPPNTNEIVIYSENTNENVQLIINL